MLKLEEIARKLFPLFAAILMVSPQLFVQPITGLADNGDFYNVTVPYQLSPLPQYQANRYFTHIVPVWYWDTSNPVIFRLLTSEWLVMLAPAMITRKFFGGVFDLRWTGLVHLSVLLVAMGVVAPVVARLPRPRQLLVWAALILIFFDAGYAVRLNTFYMDSASFIFLMLAAAFYLRFTAMPEPRRWAALGFVASSILFLTSKLQHAYLLPAFVALLLLDRRFRAVLPLPVVGVCALALTLITMPLFRTAPKDYAVFATYNVVFRDLMTNAQNPRGILQHFHLPEEFLAQTGKGGFDTDSALRDPRLKPVVIENLTHGRLLTYYLKHPAEVIRLTKFALSESSLEREPGVGNYANDVGRQSREQSNTYNFYTGLKRFLFAGRAWLYGAFLTAVSLGAVWLSWRRAPFVLAGVLAVVYCSAFEFGVSALADVADTTRHLFLFRVLQDLLLVGLIALLAIEKEKGTLANSPVRPSSRQSG